MQNIHREALRGLALVATSTFLISVLGACSATFRAFN